MLFTDFQKEIIRQISNNETYSLLKLAEFLSPYKYSFDGQTVSVVVKENDLENARKKLLDFYTVCTVLEKHFLIHKVPGEIQGSVSFSIDVVNDDGNFQTSDIVSYNMLKKYFGKTIIATGDLKEFINKGFKTKEELYQEEILKQQAKSWAWTRAISVVSFVMSVLALLAALFSTYRKVEIINPGAFSEKIKVIIEKDSPTKK